jgi:hypothetical protein
VWLRANPRPALLVSLPPTVLGLALAAVAAAAARGGWPASIWLGLAGLGVAGCAWGGASAHWLTRPRLERRGDRLWVRLRWTAVEKVPLEVIEGCLLGTAEIPAPLGGPPLETATLVIKLADRAAEWADRPTNRWLGQWCGHYLRVRGTFCERLDAGLVRRLNQQLAELRAGQPLEAGR